MRYLLVSLIVALAGSSAEAGIFRNRGNHHHGHRNFRNHHRGFHHGHHHHGFYHNRGFYGGYGGATVVVPQFVPVPQPAAPVQAPVAASPVASEPTGLEAVIEQLLKAGKTVEITLDKDGKPVVVGR